MVRVAGILLTAAVLVACQSGGGSPSPSAQTSTTPSGSGGGGGGGSKTIVIGYTVSQSGSLNVESVRQQNGLELWVKDVNDAGGIKLSDGTSVHASARSPMTTRAARTACRSSTPSS